MKKILQLSLLLLATICFAQTPAQRFNFDGNLQNAANNLTLTGANITYEAARNAAAGQAMVINNNSASVASLTTQSYINTDLTGIAPTTGFTFCFWAKINTNTTVFNENRFFTLGTQNPTNSGITFKHEINSPTLQQFRADTGTIYQAGVVIPNNTPIPGWRHYAFVYDGQAGTSTLYINGVTDGSSTGKSITITNQNLKIGLQWDAGQNSRGSFSMDELMIFNTQLSANQIMQIYSPSTAPLISAVGSSSIGSTGATISYSLNPNNALTNSSVSYRIGNGPITTVSATPATGTSNVQRSIVLTNLAPSTTYSYQVDASNVSGAVSTSPTVLTFTTFATNPPIIHYRFDGNLNEVNGGNSLVISPTVNVPFSYSNNNTAILITPNSLGTSAVFTASLANLPQGAAARTVSLRISYESGALSGQNNIFSYGSATNTQGYGFNQNDTATCTHYFWGPTDMANVTNGTSFGVWFNITLVYNGATVTIYRDGTQIAQAAKTLNTTGTTLWIGSVLGQSTNRYLNARIDDFRIYNFALAASEITALNASLSNQDFQSNNLKFNLYPNPTNSMLNIDIAADINSVEIYSLQGQKVLSGTEKQINVSNLAAGMYLVRVQDIDGAVATQKFTKQ